MMMRVSVLLLAILSFASNHSFANAVLTTNFVCGTGGPGTDHPSTDGFNYCAQNQQCPCGRCCYCECQVSSAYTGPFKFDPSADPGSPSEENCVGPFTSASGICGGSGTTFSHNSWKGAAGVDRSWPTIKDYESLMSMPSSNTPTGAFTYWCLLLTQHLRSSQALSLQAVSRGSWKSHVVNYARGICQHVTSSTELVHYYGKQRCATRGAECW